MGVLFLAVFAGGPAVAQTPEVLIGGEPDRGAQLGVLRDVLLLPTVLVTLDSDAPFLKVFDYAGRPRQALGQAGRGPGEFVEPWSLAYDSTTRRLLVTDLATSRVTVYSVRDSVALSDTWQVQPAIRDLCVSGGRVIGLGGSGSILLRFRIAGDRLEMVEEFGEPTTNHPLGIQGPMRDQVGNGPLACDWATETFYAASSLLGEVITVRDGVQQVVVLDPFAMIDLREVDRGLQFSRPSAGYFDRIVGLQLGARGIHVTLQREAAGAVAGYVLLEIPADGAAPRFIERQWHTVGLHGVDVVCRQKDPYPSVGIFHARSRCP